MKRLLFHLRQAPHGRSVGQDALEAILAASVFEPPMTVLLEGAGVLQLLGEQDPTPLGSRDIGANWSALPVFEVDDVQVHGPSLERFGLVAADLLLPVTVVDDAGMARLIAGSDQVLCF